jgi:glutamyl-tRNA synthetase
VVVNTATLDDKVLLKADGMPTYHLANVVDDYLMKITHVIRGEEWLPSTPLHVLLYNAFGWEKNMPQFVHIPLTLKPDGKGKLSKRDGDRMGFPVFPLEWVNPETGERSSGYRETGYLPEAFINILAFLGWNPGTDQELYTMDELIEAFSLDRIVKAGSRFDPEKAKWFNHQYILRKSDETLAGMIMPRLKEAGLDYSTGYVSKVMGLIKERAFLLNDLWDQSAFFFHAPGKYDEIVRQKVWKEDTPGLLRSIRSLLQDTDNFSAGNTGMLIKKFAEKNEINLGRILNPLRLLMVGTNAGPGLFDMMSVIGKQETLSRIENGLARLA